MVLRVLAGSQADWFDWAKFVGPTFHIQPDSNRMGLRLDGPRHSVPEGDLVSEPVCPGTIQVTPNGQCIILGRDGQTIGGYPRPAHIISADLDKLGQLRPGDALGFERVGLEAAEQLFRQHRAKLRSLLTRLRVAVGSV